VPEPKPDPTPSEPSPLEPAPQAEPTPPEPKPISSFPTPPPPQPPAPTVITSSPARTQTVVQAGPIETPGEVQQRIVQDEQVKEVKRVRRTYRLENAVGVFFGLIEGVLAIRLVFKLLGAKATNAFVSLLYQFTGIFAGPFEGIFGGNPMFGRFELDLASVIAMIIYALVGFGALQLAKIF
jgi:hypothetical protein